MPKNVARWLRGHRAGDKVHVHFRRGDAESDALFALGEEAAHDYVVTEIPQPSVRQRALLEWQCCRGTTANHVQ